MGFLLFLSAFTGLSSLITTLFILDKNETQNKKISVLVEYINEFKEKHNILAEDHVKLVEDCREFLKYCEDTYIKKN